MIIIHGDGGHSAVLHALLLAVSLNKRINDSLTLVQSLLRKPSFICNTLGKIQITTQSP